MHQSILTALAVSDDDVEQYDVPKDRRHASSQIVSALVRLCMRSQSTHSDGTDSDSDSSEESEE